MKMRQGCGVGGKYVRMGKEGNRGGRDLGCRGELVREYKVNGLARVREVETERKGRTG